MLWLVDIGEFAQAVRQRRLDRGWSVEEAARRADMNRVTYQRIEDGLSVRDVNRRKVEVIYGFNSVGADLAADLGPSAADIAAGELNPELAQFNDRELLQEVEARMLRAAALLHGDGRNTLRTITDEDGNRRIISQLGEERS